MLCFYRLLKKIDLYLICFDFCKYLPTPSLNAKSTFNFFSINFKRSSSPLYGIDLTIFLCLWAFCLVLFLLSCLTLWYKAYNKILLKEKKSIFSVFFFLYIFKDSCLLWTPLIWHFFMFVSLLLGVVLAELFDTIWGL